MQVVFDLDVKCDVIDNNTSESFNSLILLERHKTIINMLEDTKIKVMTRIDKLRKFVDTWFSNFSSMKLKTLEDNIKRSMKCTIDING